MEAAPGSPIEPVIHWLLAHPFFAEWSVYLMSTGEVLVGLALILGLLTRFAAFGSALINVALMLIFGWQGYECLDEWTMAALGFAISVSLMIYGTGSFSLDHYLKRDFFASLFSRNTAVVLTLASVLMTIGFYSYFFGFFHFQKRTSTERYNIVAESVVDRDDAVTLYVNGGGSANAAYIQAIVFSMEDGSTNRQTPDEIRVLRSHFMPWSKSGMVVDGVLKLRLGSKTDIAVPAGARSARIEIIDNPDPTISLAG